MAKKIHDGCVVVRNIAISKRNITDVQFLKKLNGTVLCESNRHVPIIKVRPSAPTRNRKLERFDAGTEVSPGVTAWISENSAALAFETAARKWWK